jgi:adenine-specific DNA-methyltransferase
MPDTKIDTIKHDDTRPNILTAELEDFDAERESSPKTQLYPRDPSLDPQLVWQGKDELDSEDLSVPVVPLYIQEEISPQDIIKAVQYDAERAKAAKEGRAVREQPALFAAEDFLPLEKKIEYCQHEEKWRNRLILGDSLLVMNALAEGETPSLKGQVQCIIIDPPYGIKFGSNWQATTRNVKDGKENDVSREPEVIRAFRDTWEKGIHTYLTYWRDRLTVARELLTESGSIFVQIGDENVHLVRSVLDEVFGAGNFVAQIAFATTSSATSDLLPGTYDLLLFYAKNKENVKYRQVYRGKEIGGIGASAYNRVEFASGERVLGNDRRTQGSTSGKYFRLSDMRSSRPPGDFPVPIQGREIRPTTGFWKTSPLGFQRAIKSDRVVLSGNTLNYVRYLDDFAAFPITNLWGDVSSSTGSDKVYVVQTNPKVFERCVLMTTDPGDIVLDPTCGSGTTATVAEQWGRRWVTIDSSRVALALARTRLMAAKYPAYLLADSDEGRAKEQTVSGKIQPDAVTMNDIRKGFVYERVPRVTLKSIANNEEIDAIHERWQTTLEPLRAELNATLGHAWEAWQIPRIAPDAWPDDAKTILANYWKQWIERKKEIDASIARRAETVYLYDKPYENAKAVRVCGPFTVESISPHRVVAPDEEAERPLTERRVMAKTDGEYEQTILENLKRAGVGNTKKGEKIEFEQLETFGGVYLHAEGVQRGTGSRVAVSVGPQFGTVSAEQVREAVKEARKHFDTLVICGFAFDPNVYEEAKEQTEDDYLIKKFGPLTVMMARINQDLMVGGNLLKKTGAGNLFMVFGEPDIQIRKKGEQLEIEIFGLDIYDPITGEIKPSSTDDLACWFVDTAYNEEAFIVRHAYFTGGGDPYEKLRKTLRADIDEAAWSALYSTVSRPFDAPKTGKIAVKVINHYGDEVLRVYDLAKMNLT